MKNKPAAKVLPVMCNGHVVARVSFRENMLFIVNEASGAVAKLVPPTGMVFSAPTAFTIYVHPKDRIINSLQRVGISPAAEDRQWKSMKEMAAEYRLAAARLAMKIQQKKNEGAPELEIKELRVALRDIRTSEKILAGYYEVPRPETGGCAVGWRAGVEQNWEWHKNR